MEQRIKVKETFKPENIHKEFYTGGDFFVTPDSSNIFCQCRNHIAIVDVNEVIIKQTIPPNLNEFNAYDDDEIIDDPILTFALSSDYELLASGHKSGLIKLWKWKSSELIKTWKCMHKGPLIKLAFNANNSFLASGSTDSTVRVWNIETHSCSFKLGGLEGITSILEYRKIQDDEILFASGDEHIIRGWRLRENGDHQVVYKLSGQFNKITKILFTPDNSYLISASREPTVIIWDLKAKKQIRCIPMYESIASAALLPNCIELPGFEKPLVGIFAAFGGQNGKIRVWDIISGKEVYIHDVNASVENPIVHLIFTESTQHLIEVYSDQTIILYNLNSTFSCQKQMIGYLDEILDVKFFGENDSHLIVAANSPNIYVFDKNMNCSLLRGHTDFVVSLATSRAFPNIFVSSSKDNSIRIWMMKDGVINCVAVGSRHTASVGTVALSNLSQNSFLVSGGEDNTLKLWQISALKYKQCLTLMVWKTEVAHDQPINSVCVSPKDNLIATGSQDKTAKLWSSDELSLIGVLRGHRRAIWCVKFSPVDEVLLTSSADMTLKLWSVRELSCLKTIEGQDCSVLNCSFLNNGVQIISCGNDGVIKVWLIKNNECVATLDKHSAKLWAVAVSTDESKFVTGGADSRLVFWRDVTEETRLDKIKVNQEKIEQEQRLLNLVHSNKLLPALQYAITLDRPLQAFKIIESVSCGKIDGLQNVINQLNVDQKETLLKYASEWNTNSKRSYIAQLILCFLIDEITDEKIKISNKTLEGLIAYTNRHYNRLISLLEDSQLISYNVKVMEPHNV